MSTRLRQHSDRQPLKRAAVERKSKATLDCLRVDSDHKPKSIAFQSLSTSSYWRRAGGALPAIRFWPSDSWARKSTYSEWFAIFMVGAFMNRRDFLERTTIVISAGLASGILPDRYGLIASALAAGNADQKASLEQKFAEFALAIRYEDLPADVVTSAKRVLLDTLGCAFGSVGSEPANIAETTIRKTFGNGNTATVIGYPRSATVEGALFVNGVLVRSLDMNDTYIGTEPLHPSEVIPTALAICEEQERSGRDLVEAIIVGYEASMRVNDAISFLERGFHPLCAASYGIPLIAGKVWGLPKEALANAVGISGARGFTSFVVNSGSISMMKAMGLAATAIDGVFATRLAAQGFTGPSGTLEWLASKMKPAKESLAVDLEVARYRLPRVAFKRFPVQIELQAVAEAGAILSAKINGRTQDIRTITVETYPGIIERVADPAKFRPQTKGTADHSLPVCLAMALLDGDVTVVQFEKDRWREQDVVALVGKTSVKPGESLIAKLPNGRGATVEIVLVDGQSLRETVEIPEGDALRPLSRESLERKFMSFAVPVVGKAAGERIMSLVAGIEDLKNVQELTRELKGTGKQNPS
ncbi:MmgE/PrpD family protein [Bradyrhizobium sp. WYCCWR 13023]|uniref:MmgE/PrpD family protein n=1 Tax=Bradyrhizobium zhengyangense TaxID=2911009 RepID=A0A9X1RIB0_9BRAD|nr:MmgE/PrpD family protein [Bradyrhizobium zhengyangense]MCG2632561.1 MmgE/PrpD family protein [Bradyrhizobium zhengyangense]